MMPPSGGNPMLSDADLFDIAAFVRQLSSRPATPTGQVPAPPGSGASSPANSTTASGGSQASPGAGGPQAATAASSTTGASGAAAAAPSESAEPLLEEEPPLIERSIMPLAAEGPPGLRPEFFAAEARRTISHPALPHGDPARPPNLHLFFGLYFCMTGLHGLHVLAGMSVIAWLLLRSLRGDFSSAYYAPVDLGGLYWHLVDVIWIFLFPLLYLIH
ncbi:MAG: cytochrome c oxidase subunit 3 [Phycisphaerales bacterium]|nr:cytochrome c oxidase subunit 3 [Phycisphaerales bacterium]